MCKCKRFKCIFWNDITAKHYLNIIFLTERSYGQPDRCGRAKFLHSESEFWILGGLVCCYVTHVIRSCHLSVHWNFTSDNPVDLVQCELSD